MRKLEAVIPALTLGALLVIDLDFAGTVATSGMFAQATAVELIVFAVQIGKTGAILSLKRARNAGFATILDIYGIDVILLPTLLVAFLWTGYEWLPGLLEQIILGWVIGVAMGAFFLASLKTATSMLGAQGLTKVIPLCLATAESGIQFANSATAAASSGGGFDAVMKAALTGRGLLPIASPPLLVDLGAVYILLLLYSTLTWDPGRALLQPRQIFIAVLATGGTAASVVLGSYLSVALPLMLIPPALAIVAVTWVIGHKA
jgi:hypothetical protein